MTGAPSRAFRGGWYALLIAAAVSALGPAGCDRDSEPDEATVPEAETEQGTGETLLIPDPGAVIGVDWETPEGWTLINDVRTFRVATWRVPGDNDGVIAIASFMGKTMGSSLQYNINRWAGQVINRDGSRAEPEVEEEDLGELRVTYVRAKGDFVQGMNQSDLELGGEGGAIIGAIIHGGPVGNVYLQLSGPEGRVEELRADFEELVESARLREGFEAS